MAVPNIIDVKNFINQLNIRLNKDISNIIEFNKKRLDNYKTNYVLINPLATFEIKEQKLDTLIDNLNNKIKNILDNNKKRLDNVMKNYTINNPDTILNRYNNTYELLLNKLNLLNPLNILSKGYSVVKKDNNVIKDINDINIKDKLNIKLYKGNIDVIVEGKNE